MGLEFGRLPRSLFTLTNIQTPRCEEELRGPHAHTYNHTRLVVLRLAWRSKKMDRFCRVRLDKQAIV
ncbi:hypothetical protein GOP47_0030055 [Adiantum capillus-veneris]|nr:hypothetical protein GOP47_0030055 [Adiantum capillus-veneris]